MKRLIIPTIGVAAAALSIGMFGTATASSAGHSVSHQGLATHAMQPAKKGNCYSGQQQDSGVGITSANYSDDPTLDAAGAADFAVKKTCHITGVNATGVYYNGSGPADSEDVIFYTDDNGAPGSVISSQTVTGTDSNGSFTLPINDVAIPPGRAWVSVVANMTLSTEGQWGWELSTKSKQQVGGLWENPSDGFGTGCTTWGPVATCVGFDGDFMVTLTKG